MIVLTVVAAAIAVLALAIGTHETTDATAAPSVDQLQSQLGAQQSQQQHLSSSIGSLHQLIDELGIQRIQLLRSIHRH